MEGIFSLQITLFFRTHAGRWVCKPCQNQEECDADPGLCVWGETRDSCNRKICAKVRNLEHLPFSAFINVSQRQKINLIDE